MDFESQLHNLRSEARASARKAVDYLDGYQKTWLETLLSTPGVGIKNWKDRGVFPIWENLTQMIIEKSAQTYQTAPEREILNKAGVVDEGATEKYDELLNISGFRSTADHADELARLLKTSLVLVQWNDERDALYFEILSQHNSDVDFDRVTGQFNSIIYTAGEAGPNSGEMYHYWTPEISQTYEVSGNSFTKIGPDEPNPYGIVPAATLYDIKPPRSGFWIKNVWEQLIYFNDAVNMFHTETKFNQRFGSIGSPVTNMEVPDGTVIGPDAIIQFANQNPDITPFFEYRAPQVEIDEFLNWMNNLRENVGQEWGVNIKVAGEGSADSGFKLIVEELPTLQLRKKRISPATKFEQQLYDVIMKVAAAGGVSFPEGSRVNVVFPEPELPVNEKEKWEVIMGKMASKVMSREQYFKIEYPDWTQEQIDEEIERIDAGFITIPEFGDIGTEEV